MHSFLLIVLFINSIISLYGCTRVCLNIYPIKDIWVFSSIQPLWKKLLWTFMYWFMCEHNFSFLWVKCLGLQLLNHMISMFTLVKKLPEFSRVVIPFYTILPTMYGRSFLHIFASMFCFGFFSVLIRVWWYLTEVYIYFYFQKKKLNFVQI